MNNDSDKKNDVDWKGNQEPKRKKSWDGVDRRSTKRAYQTASLSEEDKKIIDLVTFGHGRNAFREASHQLLYCAIVAFVCVVFWYLTKLSGSQTGILEISFNTLLAFLAIIGLRAIYVVLRLLHKTDLEPTEQLVLQAIITSTKRPSLDRIEMNSGKTKLEIAKAVLRLENNGLVATLDNNRPVNQAQGHKFYPTDRGKKLFKTV